MNTVNMIHPNGKTCTVAEDGVEERLARGWKMPGAKAKAEARPVASNVEDPAPAKPKRRRRKKVERLGDPDE